jgi:hypothetical protein
MPVLRYLASLSPARTVLWCYFIWWVLVVAGRFDPNPRLWLTSLGLSAIIGVALLLSTQGSTPSGRPDSWVVFRLFLMPFCVSSFSALAKGGGFFLIFPPTLHENVAGIAGIVLFVVLVRLVKARSRP